MSEDDEATRLAECFKRLGSAVDVLEGALKDIHVYVGKLIPSTQYGVYCYAEDVAEPKPNGMFLREVRLASMMARTEGKVPSVRVVKHQTLSRGFNLYVVGDAPGRVWCAAAPLSYGIPEVSAVVREGAVGDLPEEGSFCAPALLCFDCALGFFREGSFAGGAWS